MGRVDESGEGVVDREGEKWRGKVARVEGSGMGEVKGVSGEGSGNKGGNRKIDMGRGVEDNVEEEEGSHLSHLSVSVSAAFPFQTLGRPLVFVRVCACTNHKGNDVSPDNVCGGGGTLTRGERKDLC